MQVVVTGAAGQTGLLIVKKLLARPVEFITRAVVRSKEVGVRLLGLLQTLGPLNPRGRLLEGVGSAFISS